jgi:hypothetical protein
MFLPLVALIHLLQSTYCVLAPYFLFLLFVCSYSPALEHLRKKIEMSTEKIRLAKVKEEQAKKVGHFKM